MSKQVYVLQQHLPDYKKGSEIEWDGTYYTFKEKASDGIAVRWPALYVENNPEWFLPKKEESADTPFQWTEALIKEFIMSENLGYSIELLNRQINGFKQSQSTPKQEEKELTAALRIVDEFMKMYGSSVKKLDVSNEDKQLILAMKLGYSSDCWQTH